AERWALRGPPDAGGLQSDGQRVQPERDAHGASPLWGGLRYNGGDIGPGAQTRRPGDARAGGGYAWRLDPTGRFAFTTDFRALAGARAALVLLHSSSRPLGVPGLLRFRPGRDPEHRGGLSAVEIHVSVRHGVCSYRLGLVIALPRLLPVPLAPV